MTICLIVSAYADERWGRTMFLPLALLRLALRLERRGNAGLCRTGSHGSRLDSIDRPSCFTVSPVTFNVSKSAFCMVDWMRSWR